MVPKLRALVITDAVRSRIALVRRGDELQLPNLEQLRLELADEVLQAVDEQERDRAAGLRALRSPAPLRPFVEVTLRPKRSRRR